MDLDRYPIHDLDGPRARAVIAEQTERFTQHGVAIMPDFVPPAAVTRMAAEAERLAPDLYHQDVMGTPYLAAPDHSFPDGHPRRHLGRSALTAIPYDAFPADSALRALYEDDAVMAFVARILGLGRLHRYADPLGALNVAVMAEGDELAWHFDQTDFVVSIALQSSDAGGEFLNAENLRGTATDGVDGERYDDVAAVLAGAAPERVTTVAMTPGTLMLFAGRRSLHAVSPVIGPTPRYVALLAYDTKPDTNSSALLKQIRYGRQA